MKHRQACLTPEILQQLECDQLAVAELQSVEEHLNECARCRELLDGAESEFVWSQQIVPVLRSSPELCANDAVDIEYCDSYSPNAILRLLGPTDDPRMLGRIGTYEVVGIIGQGGMGVVFKAFDGALNRYVAIKMLSPSLAEMGAARKRFAREGQAAAAVIDDHVLPIYGVAEWLGVPYLIMQYTSGSTLQKRVEDQGPLELKEILRIGMQTARGLAAAHALGLVHRDVKPSNILIDDTVERALLADFGLARAVDDASITRTGMIAGTPQYMSPEQARGAAVDARSDLFSLGGVLYFMATGRQPFRADNSYAVLRLIIDQDPKKMQDINPELPIWLCTLISHLMAKAPENRPASAQEVADVLQHCLAHVQQPFAVPIPDTAPWSQKISIPRQRPWLLSALWVFALVALVVVSFYGVFGLLRRFPAQDEASRAKAAANAIAQQGPDITGVWLVTNGLEEHFSIRRSMAAPQTWEISPLNMSTKLVWTVKWAMDRQRFEGEAVIPGDITGMLNLSMRSPTASSQLDVSMTFDDLQKSRLLKTLTEDGPVPTSPEQRLTEVLVRLGHQTWLRQSNNASSQTEQPAKLSALTAASKSPEKSVEESAFRVFDSNAVSKGAEATWRKYVQWWNTTRGTPLEPSAEIPRPVWGTPLVGLEPNYIYSHGANVVIVRSQDENGEEGIYVVLGIASGHGPNDDQFTRTLIAHASAGDVYTFRRKGHFKSPFRSIEAHNGVTTNVVADAAQLTHDSRSLDTQIATDAALGYLTRNQQEDGSWDAGDDRGNVAVTALVGRAFLALGIDPGHEPNGARLTDAIKYILRNEDGGLLAEGRFAPMCEHAQAVPFLAEAYNKIVDKALRDRMQSALRRAVTVIVDGQNREGGWRYNRTPRDADISVTCYQLHALAAAKRAGFDVPQAVVDKGVKYILSCLDTSYGDRFRYMPKIPSTASSTFEYTVAAISTLNAVGYSGDKEPLERCMEFLRSDEVQGAIDAKPYECHYYMASIVKAADHKDRNAWYSAIRADLLKKRNKDGGWGNPLTSSYSDTALVLIILYAR